MLTVVRDEQYSKAQCAIDVTLVGMLTVVRDEHFSKALSPIVVTPFGIFIVPVKPLATAIRVLPSFVYIIFLSLLYFSLPESTVSVFKFLQLPKAPFPIDVTLFGMVILLRDEQPSKALSPIDVTRAGMVIAVRLKQSLKVLS